MAGEFKVARVSVERDQPSGGPEAAGNRQRMSATPQRAVDHRLAGSWIEQIEGFAEQDGVVPRFGEVGKSAFRIFVFFVAGYLRIWHNRRSSGDVCLRPNA